MCIVSLVHRRDLWQAAGHRAPGRRPASASRLSVSPRRRVILIVLIEILYGKIYRPNIYKSNIYNAVQTCMQKNKIYKSRAQTQNDSRPRMQSASGSRHGSWHMGWHMAGLMLFRVVVTRCMGMGIGMEHEHACGSV